VIAHGSGDRADEWPLDLADELRSLSVSQSLWDTYRVDWYEASLDRLAAPRVGYELGTAIGAQLAGAAHAYEVVHLIGHSAGAHIVQGIADAIAAQRLYVHITFLDPFVGRSILQLSWGVSRLGRNADFAESYVTRRDNVPFTNSLLERAHNFDLTHTVPNDPHPPQDFAHMWPVRVYLASAAHLTAVGECDAGAADLKPVVDPCAESGVELGVALAPIVWLGPEVRTREARRCGRGLAELLPPGEATVVRSP
jgi:hypothetical protein